MTFLMLLFFVDVRMLWASAFIPVLSGQPSFPDLMEATLEDLATGLESGAFTSVDLVAAYTLRIMEVNTTLKVVTTLNPDAHIIAATADAQRRLGATLGPLHGIPVLLKDNIATADKMPNTAGSYALFGAQVLEDATVVRKLRNAGAIILGKANLSEWANFRSRNSSNGWSAYGGQTEGAYLPGQDPNSSSSGSGVAVSIGLSFAALGTETDGSIILPAEANNVVGIKPTVGLTSRYLIVPVSEHQDTVGPMARTVKDAAYLLAAIAGPDPNDNYTSAIPFQPVPDYVAACDEMGLQGKRIGVPRHMFAESGDQYDTIMATFNQSMNVLRAAGAEVIEDVYLPGYEFLKNSDLELSILAADFDINLSSYLAKLRYNPNNITSLSGLQSFTKAVKVEEWTERDMDLWEIAIKTPYNNKSPEFWARYTEGLFHAGARGLTGVLEQMSLDALVSPSKFQNHLAAMVGAPVITVPLGRLPDNYTSIGRNSFGNLVTSGANFPFGISFTGAHFSEATLITMAYAFEQKTRVRQTIQPYLAPKTSLANVVNVRWKTLDHRFLPMN